MEPPQIHSIIGIAVQENSRKGSAPVIRLTLMATDRGVLMAVSPNMKAIWRLKTEPGVKSDLGLKYKLNKSSEGSGG